MASWSWTSHVDRRRWPKAGTRAAIVVVAGLAIAGCPLREGGRMTILNDLPRTVKVGQCDNNECTKLSSPGTMSPGERWPVNVSLSGLPNPHLVLERDSKTRLGCLPLVMRSDEEGVVARTSQATICKKHYDEDQPWPPR